MINILKGVGEYVVNIKSFEVAKIIGYSEIKNGAVKRLSKRECEKVDFGERISPGLTVLFDNGSNNANNDNWILAKYIDLYFDTLRRIVKERARIDAVKSDKRPPGFYFNGVSLMEEENQGSMTEKQDAKKTENTSEQKWFISTIKAKFERVNKDAFKTFLKKYPRKLDRDFFMDKYTYNDFELACRWPWSIVAMQTLNYFAEDPEDREIFEICANVEEMFSSLRCFNSEKEMIEWDNRRRQDESLPPMVFKVIPPEENI